MCFFVCLLSLVLIIAIVVNDDCSQLLMHKIFREFSGSAVADKSSPIGGYIFESGLSVLFYLFACLFVYFVIIFTCLIFVFLAS